MNQAARPPWRQWVGRANAATIGAAAAEQIDFTRLPLLPTAPTTARRNASLCRRSKCARGNCETRKNTCNGYSYQNGIHPTSSLCRPSSALSKRSAYLIGGTHECASFFHGCVAVLKMFSADFAHVQSVNMSITPIK